MLVQRARFIVCHHLQCHRLGLAAATLPTRTLRDSRGGTRPQTDLFPVAGLKCPAVTHMYPTLACPLRLSQHRMRRRLTHRHSLLHAYFPQPTLKGRESVKRTHTHTRRHSRGINRQRHGSDYLLCTQTNSVSIVAKSACRGTCHHFGRRRRFYNTPLHPSSDLLSLIFSPSWDAPRAEGLSIIAGIPHQPAAPDQILTGT
jgi:hypothetical protein